MKHYRGISVFLFLVAWESIGLGQEDHVPSSRQLGRSEKFRVLVDKVLMQQGPQSNWRMKDEFIREMRDAGFNVVVPRHGAEDLGRVRDVAQRAKKHGMCYMPWLRGTLHAYYKNSDRKRMVWKSGAESRMYSPNADDFWQWWTPLIVGYAKISAQENSLIGVFLDFENYFEGESGTAYDLSYDDIIFREFIAAQKRKQIAVAPKDRHAWLAKQGLHEKFAAYQIGRWQTKCRALRKAIDAVNPRFQIFVYPTPVESLFIRKAVAQELATAKAPMVIADWRTYGRPPGAMTSEEGLMSNRLYLETKLRANQELNIPHAMYISGIDPVLKHTDPEFCGRGAVMISEKADGYWVFYEGPKYETTHKDYFRWFARGNRAIVDGEYSFWKEKRETPEPLATKELTHPKAIQKVLSEPITVRTLADKLATAEAIRRYELRDDQHIVIQSKTKKNIHIGLSNRNSKLTRILTYAVYDSEGIHITRGSLVDKTDIRFSAIAGETYHLFLTGPGFFTLNMPDVPYAVDGRKHVHFRGHATPLYFHVPAEVRSFTVTMRSGIPGETAVAKLLNPQNRPVATFRTVERPVDKQTIDCGDNSGGHWKLVVNKADKGVLDDVYIQFGPELNGYCSLEPEKVLVMHPAETRRAR